jgi:Tol biopolymer transport system component
VWQEFGELEIGAESWNFEAREKRWGAARCELREGSAEIIEEDFDPGPAAPLVTTLEGEIVHRSGDPGPPAISMDGSRVAFTVLEGTTLHILLADFRNRTITDLFCAEKTDFSDPPPLSLSDSGDRLAFRVDRKEGSTAHCLDLAANRIARIKDSVEIFGLSGDGRRLLCSIRKGGGAKFDGSLAVLDLETHRSLEIVDLGARRVESPRLSADGGHIALTFQGNVYVIDLASRSVVNASKSFANDSSLAISRDGSRVFFESDRMRSRDVFLADLAAERLTHLTRETGYQSEFAISGDGRRIICLDSNRRYFSLIDLESGKKRRISGSENSWSLQLSGNGRIAANYKWRQGSMYVAVQEFTP